jgi:hypothetical protein
MFENEHEFRKLVGHLKIDDEPNPAHRERLRRQMLHAFELAQGTQEQKVGTKEGKKVRIQAGPRIGGSHLPTFLPSYLPALRLAIAAAILIAATVGAWSLVGRGPATFQQVRLATQKMPWLYAVVSRYQGSDLRTERHWYNFAAQKAFAVIDDSVVGWDYGAAAQKLVYSPRLRALQVFGLSGTDPTENVVNVFALFAAQDKVLESTAPYDGRTVRTFEVQRAGLGLRVDSRPVSRLRMAVMADPRTRHVIAARVEYEGSSGSLIAREEWVMSYPPSGPASVYDLGVPTGTAILDSRQQPIGTPNDVPTPVATPAPASGFRLAPVEIRLPKPMFAGTPRDARTPNLERPRDGLRPPFLAPVGTRNVALGKPVVSSDPEPVIGNLSAITDGDKEAAEGSFVELSPGPQHVTIDLRERCDVYAVVVWHYHRWPRAYLDVVVQVADDPAFKTRVQTIFNNDSDASLGLGAGRDLSYVETYEGKLLEGKGARGRYVRLFSNGNTRDDLNHYIEVEVYGRPLD